MLQSHISHGKLFVSKTNRFVCHILVTSMFEVRKRNFSPIYGKLSGRQLTITGRRFHGFLSDIEFQYFFIELHL